MKNIKIARTGLCIFLMFIPIIALVFTCFILSMLTSSAALGSGFLKAVCAVGMILCVILICVFMYRTGPALAALMLLGRIKKQLDDKSRAELEETTLFDFIAIMRQKPDASAFLNGGESGVNEDGENEDDEGEAEDDGGDGGQS